MLFKNLMLIFAGFQCVAVVLFVRYQRRLVKVTESWREQSERGLDKFTERVYREEPPGNKQLRIGWFLAALFFGSLTIISFALDLLHHN